MGGVSHRMVLGWGVAVLALLSASACDKTVKTAMTDTEGRTFSVTCEGQKCELTDAPSAKPSAPKPDGAEAAFVLHTASRLFAVCEVWKQGASHAINPADCRALVCKADADCPHAKNMTRGACTNGLCTEPSGPSSNEDAVMLCLAGTGVPSGSMRQVERYALGNACTTPCQVPAVCRQP